MHCIPGVFDWFGKLWRLSGWCEGKCRGIKWGRLQTKQIIKVKKVERNNEQRSYSGERLLSNVRANVDAIEKNNRRILA